MDIEVIFDTPKYHQDGKLWCHMTSNDLERLHDIAKTAGLKREWFQDKPGHPHYDVYASNVRKRLVALGAEMVHPK